MSSRSFKGKHSRGKPSPKRAGLKSRHSSTGCPSILETVAARPDSDLDELHGFWSGRSLGDRPADATRSRAEVVEWMNDPDLIEERVGELSMSGAAIVDRLLTEPRFRCGYPDLAGDPELSYLSGYDLEASLNQLERQGWIVETTQGRFQDPEARAYTLPAEVGESLRLAKPSRRRSLFEVLTLRGHLDRLYSDPKGNSRSAPLRLREMYKMYGMESAAVARIDRLPDGVRALIEKAILEFGGILPRNLFERMKTDLPHWNGRRWRMILEKSLVGTVEKLDLASYGIRHNDETLVVFNEVALAWLRRVAVPGDPDAPHEELSLGIDLVSNLSHFLAFIHENDVRFTVQGEIFKTTERKILQHLIPNPGRELSREEVLAFIYGFAKKHHLIDRTGERTIAMTREGREWGRLDLNAKLAALLDHAIEEHDQESDGFHEKRLREIFLRLIKRIEPDTWYDLMYLPFLTRNTYLSQLADLGIDSEYEDYMQAGQNAPGEDAQRLAWSLVRWVRKRLYLLGLLDLGYDSSKRPVAMRLTQTGARLFGLPGTEGKKKASVGNLVVTPDFEIVLFPTGDDSELVHDLDRFCERDKQGHLLHYHLTEASIRRALTEGISLQRIHSVFETHSRTPVPQNVSFSIRDWASRAGLMKLDSKLRISTDNADCLRRFLQDAGVRPYLGKTLGTGEVQLKGRITAMRMQVLLQDLGFLVELVPSSE